MRKEEKLNWKNIPLSKEINPREVIDKRPLGNQYGKKWSFRPGEAFAKSMFADGYSKKNK